MTRLARVHMSTELLERIMTAADNEFVHTDCPQDLKILKVLQDSDDQSNHRVVLVVSSEDEVFPDVSEEARHNALISGHLAGIPLLEPFQYTVDNPDED